jgi:hypothetical protein
MQKPTENEINDVLSECLDSADSGRSKPMTIEQQLSQLSADAKSLRDRVGDFPVGILSDAQNEYFQRAFYALDDFVDSLEDLEITP